MKLPDGPQTPPAWQLMQWIADPTGYLEAGAQRYGDTFTGRIAGFPPLVFVSHPQAIEEIFTAKPGQFDSGSTNNILRPLLGDNSLLLLDGLRHQRQRKLLMPPFHGERMRSYGQQICEISTREAESWTIGQRCIARVAMQEITMKVILRVVFGLDEGERYQKLKPLLTSMLDTTGSPLSSSVIFIRALQRDLGAWSPWGRFLRLQRQVDELLYAEIRERRQQLDPSRTDILTLMLLARDENGEPMTDGELHDELMTLLVAGHETTATALAWAFYWIHRYPSVREKLLPELDALGDNPDPMAIFRLPYLTAVCQETLRIYPVSIISFLRMVKSEISIMGQQIDPQAALVPCIYLTHRRPDIYPEPTQFKPERFVERQFSPYEFLPFGGGNRACIGMALAMFEMKLVLATILSSFSLALADNRPVRPHRRGATLTPAGGIPIVVTGRRQLARSLFCGARSRLNQQDGV